MLLPLASPALAFTLLSEICNGTLPPVLLMVIAVPGVLAGGGVPSPVVSPGTKLPTDVADTKEWFVMLTEAPVRVMMPTVPALVGDGDVDWDSMVAADSANAPVLVTSIFPALPEVLVEVLRVLAVMAILPGDAAPA
jgi:hypothetical protein